MPFPCDTCNRDDGSPVFLGNARCQGHRSADAGPAKPSAWCAATERPIYTGANGLPTYERPAVQLSGSKQDQTSQNVRRVHFGSAADRRRAELADSLALIAEHIRSGELEWPPHGWVLLLQSEANPARFEVLNKSIATKADMEQALSALRRHIATT